MVAGSVARHGAFHPLRVADVERLTDDAVVLTFEVPAELRDVFRFAPGQHIALRRYANGGEIRRTYSVCDPAPAAESEGPRRLRVGVRLVEGGEFSTYALKELVAGETLEVMTPAGRFGHALPLSGPGHYAAIVGGSGITPVLSIAATVLERQPQARFCLIRSDRSTASTMFLEEVADLKDRYPDRLQLVHVLSREEQQAGLPTGRLDQERLTELLPALLRLESVDGWFLCGPYGLVEDAERALRGLGVPRARIHQEIFHVDEGSAKAPGTAATGKATGATISATLDGRGGSWPAREGESVLETVLRNRADAPYACKGGVCGTCRVRLVEGEVRMDRNFALEPDELAAGYVLACQSHPATERVTVDFDA
ncbi:1,2-phenylacetyl-CoA epoxidase subunit PaaE [Streptomyces silvisoli]|uniref:Phenylacetate-CoA oxygenase/reductase subunit PaaK n=1 Tax=Streptomyces silvisoli TaxID=3034235 RepID=A0ABT5ZMV1_9ACTN|nr:1,2-phenylacetyl-CoA epoxidase subunit PaaE [Streptomyces silvisoli]MDF3290904.1 phenylacetate-CoA oxygenase/reductase subunit PaaK [Streptomyces silvisoli]